MMSRRLVLAGVSGILTLSIALPALAEESARPATGEQPSSSSSSADSTDTSSSSSSSSSSAVIEPQAPLRVVPLKKDKKEACVAPKMTKGMTRVGFVKAKREFAICKRNARKEMIVNRIDKVLNKLESIEKTKLDRER